MPTTNSRPTVGSTGKIRKKYGRWRMEHAFRIYELAAAGATHQAIADALEVDYSTITNWLRENELAVCAYQCGQAQQRSRKKPDDAGTFADYVYARLPDHCRELWDELAAMEKESSSQARIEALLAPHGVTIRKHLFLYALVTSSFNPSDAMRRVNVSRRALSTWMHKDPEFAELCDEIQYHKKNFFESRLVDLAAAGDSGAVLFANRTLNRDRGYNDKFELQLSGTVNVNHQIVAIDALDLPLETRKLILERLRCRKWARIETDLMPDAPDELPPEGDEAKTVNALSVRNLADTVDGDFWDDSP